MGAQPSESFSVDYLQVVFLFPLAFPKRSGLEKTRAALQRTRRPEDETLEPASSRVTVTSLLQLQLYSNLLAVVSTALLRCSQCLSLTLWISLQFRSRRECRQDFSY